MSAYDSQIPYKPIDEPVRKSRSNQNFDKLTVGSGSQRFEVNVKDGLWMGADTFAEGKFSVDFDGDVIANSILIKNASGDTLINSNASVDFVNVLNSKLNTNTQKLLKDFTFDGYTGAFKTGDITWNTGTGAITGGTGGLLFSKGLIFAKSGTPTIVLDGETGDATFSGTLTAASGSLGAITIGTNAWHVDSSGNMWWGNYANYASATIKISSAGVANFTGANISGTITITGGSGVANLSDAGNLATLDNVGASNCNTTIISGGRIITGLLTADNIQAGTLIGRDFKANGGSGTDVWMQNDGYIRWRYSNGTKGFMWCDSLGRIKIDADESFEIEFNSNGGSGEFFDIYEDGNSAFYIDGSKDGKFQSDLDIAGTLSKGGGSFKIDHPLKPKSHYLFHSFVESPDMLNIYKGRSRTKNKKAIIELPDYFEALNKDFEYQLTPIKKLAIICVKKEIKNNKFEVESSEDCEFSWQVTGVRKDRFALNNPIINEVEKEFGHYIHPELWENEIDEEQVIAKTLERLKLKDRSDLLIKRKVLQRKIAREEKEAIKNARIQRKLNEKS
jgi:hypothetical protein